MWGGEGKDEGDEGGSRWWRLRVGWKGERGYERQWKLQTVKGLEHRVVAPLDRVSVEEELRGSVPEDLVGWELEKDLGIRS